MSYSTQLAFILNLEHHWFTLRRFGHADPDVNRDEGNGHWYNLNSFLPRPEWVGKLYLGMVLQQAEADGMPSPRSVPLLRFILVIGYSVFAVTQADSLAPLALPRTGADEVASTLREPRSTSPPRFRSIPSAPTKKTPISHITDSEDIQFDEEEDDDYELQAALQASLVENGAHEYVSPQLVPAVPPSPSASVPTQSYASIARNSDVPLSIVPGPHAHHLASSIPGHADVDPVTAGIERNRVLLQRMREQQEIAQRELWEADDGREERMQAQARQEAEEAENLRKAIEESKALARKHHPSTLSDDEEGGGNVDVGMATTGSGLSNNSFAPQLQPNSRVYDDDDAELQAALKASLEQMPVGWLSPPELPSLLNQPQSNLTQSTLPVSDFPLAPLSSSTSSKRSRDVEDDEYYSSEEERPLTNKPFNSSTSPPHAEPQQLSLEEIRKRRLARFGGQ